MVINTRPLMVNKEKLLFRVFTLQRKRGHKPNYMT